jgi:ABC-type glycerol-3-phosphate transport system permease component
MWRQLNNTDGAACFMSSLPLIVIFLVFRKSFVSGITAGAFK